MPIDYSKWDKIELSDDSDVEVHPNVDKRSFIKWKQQSIHETRMKRSQDIKNLEVQVHMYACLNKRVDKLLANVSDEELGTKESISKYLNGNFDKTEKSEGENVDPDIPSYNEMVEDLFEQLQKDAEKQGRNLKDGSVLRELALEHRKKIDKVTVEAKTKLEELYREKSAHISSDDISTGFDSGFLNKNKEDAKLESTMKEIAANNGAANSTVALPLPPMQFIEYEDVMKLAPETETFGSISSSDYKKSQSYLLDNMPIISEQQKDALMMKAFEYQMSNDEKSAYRVIHQSELLAYIREIYDMKKIGVLKGNEMTEVINVFFKRVIFGNNIAGKQSFLQSVQAKFDHVKKRVKIMEQEQEAEEQGVETIQLKSLDESNELEVNLPDFDSSDPNEMKRVAAFKKLPPKMQDAVSTKNLDTVNEVFAETPIKEAEEYLELFGEADIIGVKALLENEEDFNQLKSEYQKENILEELSIGEQDNGEQVNTTDTVD
ncbi:hypothetical protein HG535_0F04050 [Zygotorulaspora mrakii]|uniref:Hsp90 chaperone protein kinase-targeting subunit n=1 Tax=Zygotorulaspora mrakii TaxID=42260 RepID=A0A7H9B5Y0_ZYGMR|nr:uncharacterized protein HG535_0F04050 [Zygotorulaspora mrakii]QLG73893.1 hypothetical protein HG535_0F04050 [Zygotorulaspora mrakii]